MAEGCSIDQPRVSAFDGARYPNVAMVPQVSDPPDDTDNEMQKRGMALALTLAIVVAGMAAPAGADEPDLYPMYFPVVGEHNYTDTFGAPRSGGRTHEGIDILADKMVPVVAVADGSVGWMHNEQGGNCCAMALNHDDGWTSWYIHLNNDTPGTDDGLGWGFDEGIEPGAHVVAGQLIGWVGDSGNAEATVSHLHFELHQPGGVKTNPYAHLEAAQHLESPLSGVFVPPFRDDEGSIHEPAIIDIAERGITYGCSEYLYCPDELVTRGQMAAFLQRALDLPPVTSAPFSDTEGHTFASSINAIAEAGITTGCAEGLYCPDDPVSREQMASFLARAFELAPDGSNFFNDDEGSTHEAAINALALAGVTTGCAAGQYCPRDSVTRAQMASFLSRALFYGEGA